MPLDCGRIPGLGDVDCIYGRGGGHRGRRRRLLINRAESTKFLCCKLLNSRRGYAVSIYCIDAPEFPQKGSKQRGRERKRDRLKFIIASVEVNHCVNYRTHRENDMQTSGRLLCSRRLKLWHALRTHNCNDDDDDDDEGMGIALRQRERDITRTTSRNWVAACYEFIVSLLISSAGNFLL